MDWENQIKLSKTKNFILDIDSINKISIYQEQKIPVQSITKSFTSLAIGFLLEDNIIRNINDPIYKYLPQSHESSWMLHSKKYVTFKTLLTHTSGLVGSEFWFSPEKDDYLKSKDIFAYILNIPLKRVGRYRYSNLGTQLLSCILTHLIDMNMEEYLKIKLFKKMNISSDQYSFNTFNEKYSDGYCGLSITIKALHKVAICLYNDGIYKNKQVISKYWITRIFKPKKNRYSYFFFVDQNDEGIRMFGDYGNFVFISKKRKIIMTRLNRIGNSKCLKYWTLYRKRLINKTKICDFIDQTEGSELQKLFHSII
jgi:CubicO group peptidase (beta-lactamase class C family)